MKYLEELQKNEKMRENVIDKIRECERDAWENNLQYCLYIDTETLALYTTEQTNGSNFQPVSAWEGQDVCLYTAQHEGDSLNDLWEGATVDDWEEQAENENWYENILDELIDRSLAQIECGK